MREIEFRGLCILDDKQWRFGLYHYNHYGNEHMIIPPIGYSGKGLIMPYSVAQVNPDTIGQFTGLTDKFGVRIFEGDIVQTLYDGLQAISFSHAGFGYPDGKIFVFISSFVNQTEVIGNIHQNAELLAQ